MDLERLFTSDEELMAILSIIADLGLKDAWLAAGTLRNYVWNSLSGKNGLEEMSDLDVVFFDPELSYEASCQIERDLQKRFPNYQWELKNQVYMHIHSPNTLPYTSACDAVSKYPERCTAIAARLKEDKLELFLPYGDEDIVNFIVRPTPHFTENSARMETYRKRQQKKDWRNKWKNLQIVGI